MARKRSSDATAHGMTSVPETLAKVLADTAVLAMKTQNFHWNVTGPHFASLHELFGAQYTELNAAIDELAERLRALGETAPGSFASFLSATVLEEATGQMDARSMVRMLADDHGRVADRAKQCLQAAQRAGDEATTDMMVERVQVHDKAAWMLKATADGWV